MQTAVIRQSPMKQGKQEKVSERRYSGRRISHRTTIFKWIVARAIRHRIKKYAPHETNKTKANKEKHEKGDARRNRDQGGEKKKQKKGWKSRK